MKKIMLCLLCLFCLVGCQKEVVEEQIITPTSQQELGPQEKMEETTTETQLPKEDTSVIDESTNTPTTPPPANVVPNNDAAVTNTPEVETTPPQATPPPIVEEDPIAYVTLSIECHTILNNLDKLKPGYKQFIPESGYLLAPTRIEIEEGENVYHLLERVSQLYSLKLSGRSGYVSGIGNIDEYACGNLSGWMYAVNNTYMNVSSIQKVLQDGDSVKWMYTCNNGRDLSFN